MSIPPMRRETGARIIGGEYNVVAVASSTMSSLGAIAGDYLMVIAPNGGTPSLSGVGAGNDLLSGVSSWQIGSGDLSRTVANGGIAMSLVIFRGVTSAARVAVDSAGGAVTNDAIAGFTKNAAHAGLIGYVASPTSGSALSIGAPPAWATVNGFNASSGTYRRQNILSRLYPANVSYINSTAFAWSTADASGGVVAIYELRS